MIEAHKFFFWHSRDYVGDICEYNCGWRRAYIRFMWFTLKETA
jgi:hypothetical protein